MICQPTTRSVQRTSEFAFHFHHNIVGRKKDAPSLTWWTTYRNNKPISMCTSNWNEEKRPECYTNSKTNTLFTLTEIRRAAMLNSELGYWTRLDRYTSRISLFKARSICQLPVCSSENNSNSQTAGVLFPSSGRMIEVHRFALTWSRGFADIWWERSHIASRSSYSISINISPNVG